MLFCMKVECRNVTFATLLYFREEFLRLVREGELTMECEANDKTDNLDME